MAVRETKIDQRQWKLGVYFLVMLRKTYHNHMLSTSAAQQRKMADFIKACTWERLPKIVYVNQI
jgi:hypothetical protein